MHNDPEGVHAVRQKIAEWRRIANPDSAYGQAMLDCADGLEAVLEDGDE